MQPSRSLFYYGWCVLIASALAELLAQGATSYAAGLFVLPLQAEFHISRALANSSASILFLGSALAAPLAGGALDRWPIRLVVPLGALLFGGALAFIAHAPALWMMALALFVPAAAGFMMIGPLTTSTLAARWFWRRRGLAMGIAAVATSGGGFVVVPLLSRAIQTQGWRAALFHEALLITAAVIVLSLVLRDSPASVGLQSDPEIRDRPAQAARQRLNWRRVLGRRAFWFPTLALASISGICQAIVVTLKPYGLQLGLTASQSVLAISLFALAAAVTKLVVGWLADRLDQQVLILAALVIMLLSELLLWLWPAPFPLLAAAMLAGVALGCALPTAAGLIAQAFGAACFGAAMGWTYVVVLVTAIAAPYLAGAAFDATHGYGAAFLGFVITGAAVFAAALVLRRPVAA